MKGTKQGKQPIRIAVKRKLHETPVLFPEMTDNPWYTDRCPQPEDRVPNVSGLMTLELCAGAGGQALGYEQAGIGHAALVELNRHACATLRLNRPDWKVVEQDLNAFSGSSYKGVDIISGGLPCPPFSIAGKQLGTKDERNLFPTMIRLVDEVRPRAVMIENVRGILDAVFEDYRRYVGAELQKLGYQPGWKLMNASDFGVSQLRPRVVFVAVRKDHAEHFAWPEESTTRPKSVGSLPYDLIAANGWKGARAWRSAANEIAPTVVGGSHKHGGPDLGPTRARRAWATLGVDGLGIANEAPGPDFVGIPRLTVAWRHVFRGFQTIGNSAGEKPLPIGKLETRSLHRLQRPSRRSLESVSTNPT